MAQWKVGKNYRNYKNVAQCDNHLCGISFWTLTLHTQFHWTVQNTKIIMATFIPIFRLNFICHQDNWISSNTFHASEFIFVSVLTLQIPVLAEIIVNSYACTRKTVIVTVLLLIKYPCVLWELSKKWNTNKRKWERLRWQEELSKIIKLWLPDQLQVNLNLLIQAVLKLQQITCVEQLKTSEVI